MNPLVITGDGDIVLLDGKINFDSNALYRHPQIMELRDLTEEEPSEVEASEHGLSYIKLDGNIGCLVNGAGLAMATMDIIKQVGLEPANFLDVGGSATAAKVTQIIASLYPCSPVLVVLIVLILDDASSYAESIWADCGYSSDVFGATDVDVVLKTSYKSL